MWPTLKSAIDFSRSPLLCVVKMELPKKYRNYQTNEFIWQLHIGDFFFMSKYKSLMTLMMSFSFANDKYTRFFFLTSWTWTKNGVLNFKCTRFNLHKHFSNVSQFPFMNTSSNFIYNDKAITCLKKKTHPCFRWFLLKKKRHLISEDNSGMEETGKPEPLKTNVAMKNHQHFKTEYFHSTLNEIEASETDL